MTIEEETNQTTTDFTDTEATASTSNSAPNVTESEEALRSMATMSSTPAFNDPKSYLEAPFSYRFSKREDVSLASGSIEYREKDFTLPGRNGFDLTIARAYSSEDAGFYEMSTESYGDGLLRTGRRDNTHYLKQYGLGLGWRFILPSIETVPESLREPNTSYSDFLHLEDGRNLEIEDNNGALSFKDYPLQDVTVEASSGTLTHPCGSSVTAEYDIIVSYKNGHKDYFKKVLDGTSLDHYTLTARKDRFENCLFFDIAPYGGMEITDSWGRKVVLKKLGETLTWTLPPDGGHNSLTLQYMTDGEKVLLGFRDMLGRVTKYSYHSPDTYSAVCKSVSTEYGDTDDILFPWMMLKEIAHPSGAKTLFTYGGGKEALPLKLSIGEHGGYRQFFPIMKREDISENRALQTVEYFYTLSGDGTYIEHAAVEKLSGVSEHYTFSDSASKNQLTHYERRHNGKTVIATDYVYGTDASAADYRLIRSETETTYGNSVSREKVTSYTYSADKKANVTAESVGFPEETALGTETTYAYGSCSILTEKRTKLSVNRYVSEQYTLDSERNSLVPSYRQVFEIIDGVSTLREKTQYIYGENALNYLVTEERRFLNLSGSSSADYVSVLYGYGAEFLHEPTSVAYTGITDADGKPLPEIIEHTEYDIFGNITRASDGGGNDTLYEYDAPGRLVKEQTPKVNNRRYTKTVFYDDKNNSVTTADENGNFTRVEYSGLGLPLRAYLAEGEQPSESDVLAMEYAYDSSCRLIAETCYDGAGSLAKNVACKTLYSYDAFDRLAVKEVPAVRYYETHSYDDVCVLPYDPNSKGSLHETRIAGEDCAPDIVTKSYCNLPGFVETEYLAGDLQARYSYDLAGNKLSQTDALGNVTSFAVDYTGRTISVTKPFGNTEVTAETVFDPLGRRTGVTDFLGNSAAYGYDALGRLFKTVTPFDPRSAETKNRYDPCGNLIKKEVKLSESDWRITNYRYDGLGRLTDSFDYTAKSFNSWQQVHTEYDGAGNKLSVSSCETGYGQVPAWQTQSYTYDRFGNVLCFTDYAGNTETNVYNAVGRLLRKTLRDGTVQSFEYDALGRVIKERADMQSSAGETPTMHETEYTRTGQKKRQVAWEKNTLHFYSALVFSRLTFVPLTSEFCYNAKGQLIRQVDPDGERKEYTYDLSGNRTNFKLYRKDSIETTIDLCYTYDNNSRLTAVTQGETTLASYTYDANGGKLSQTNANGTVASYTLNSAGLVTKLENKLGSAVLSSWDYEYRLDGIQTAKTNKDGLKTSYRYDLIGSLIEEQQSTESENADGETVVSVTGTISYAYDQYGNRTGTTATGFPVYSENYVYDGANRLTSRTRTENGETHTTANVYDLCGNLIRSVKDEGASAVTTIRGYNGFGQQVLWNDGTTTVRFRYRPDGLRFSKQVIRGSGANQTSTVTTHYWDGQDIVLDISERGATKACYLRGSGELISQEIGEQTSFYLHNAHGDVTERVDSFGNILKRYVYDSFGNIINPATVGDPNEPLYVDQSPFGYCGEYLDRETQEIYLRARYYDSTSGRFLCEDPQRDTPNWYAYCGNDPVDRVDPSGEIAFFLLTAIVGAVVGAVVGGVKAAKEGKSVLKGALGGRIIGGAIGLGTGALAAAALAGGIAASTTAVITGAKAIATIAATGGITAALSKAGSNLKTAGQQITQSVSSLFSKGNGGKSPSKASAASPSSSAPASSHSPVSSSAPALSSVPSASSAPTASPAPAASSPSTVEKISSRVRVFTKNNFRSNLQKLTGNAGENLQAHHVFPQKFGESFSKIGIQNIHYPEYGSWVYSSHQHWSYAYNNAWIDFFNPEKIGQTKEDAYALAVELANKYGYSLNFGEEIWR